MEAPGSSETLTPPKLRGVKTPDDQHVNRHRRKIVRPHIVAVLLVVMTSVASRHVHGNGSFSLSSHNKLLYQLYRYFGLNILSFFLIFSLFCSFFFSFYFSNHYLCVCFFAVSFALIPLFLFPSFRSCFSFSLFHNFLHSSFIFHLFIISILLL